MKEKIYFLYGKEDYDKVNIDEDYGYFNEGVRVWIVQTYLILKKAGSSVEITSSIPRQGVLIFHRSQLNKVMVHHGFNKSPFLICVRADKAPATGVDASIVQNKHSAKSASEFFIPHWPQPGLNPRDSERGTKVEVIAYKGHKDNLNNYFDSYDWKNFIEKKSLTWSDGSIKWKGRNENYDNEEISWNDYRKVDIVVSVRKNIKKRYSRKPASKLINAWMAGAPAILGPEKAYREIRRSRLDYIEVETKEELKGAIVRLKNRPELYQKMVKNGRKRAKEFERNKVKERWKEVISEETLMRRKLTNLMSLRKVPLSYRKKWI
jgi:hypothetical protein